VRDKNVTIEQVLTLLAEGPRRIAALTDGLEPARLHTTQDHDEWSANDILAHLRACSDVWGGSIVTMVREDHPTIRAISPRTWIYRTDYPDRAFTSSFEAYSRQRAELVSFLEALTREQWARGGTFTGAGRLLERTVLSEASAIAVHERPHIKQIERIVQLGLRTVNK
jgi:DinB superfamily